MYLTINGFPYSAFPEYSCLAFSTPCNFVTLFPFLAVSTPAFWDILEPLFPFPLFHDSHFERPRRQANFAALNRERQLYSAGRPLRWALARILVLSFFRRLISAVGDWMSTILLHMVWP